MPYAAVLSNPSFYTQLRQQEAGTIKEYLEDAVVEHLTDLLAQHDAARAKHDIQTCDRVWEEYLRLTEATPARRERPAA